MHKLHIILVRISYLQEFSKKTLSGEVIPYLGLEPWLIICANMHLEHENMTHGQFRASTRIKQSIAILCSCAELNLVHS